MIFSSFLALVGCQTKAESVGPTTPQHEIAQASVSKKNDDRKNNISHLIQCNRNLEALRTVDAAQYRRYQADYDALMKSSEGFVTVQDEVSLEVAALARPRFQFALVNLCYRIKNALAQTLIKQAEGGGI